MTRLTAPVRAAVLFSALAAVGCQKPTDPSDTVRFDEAVDIAANPDPIVADNQTGGRTYRVVRGNNQPDDILAYDWHTVFSASISLNSNADDDDLDIFMRLSQHHPEARLNPPLLVFGADDH